MHTSVDNALAAWRVGDQRRIPIVPAVSFNEAGHPIHAKLTAVSGFSSEAISEWAKRQLAPGINVLSYGLACFRALTKANCQDKLVVTGGKYRTDLPQFRWIKTLLGNLKIISPMQSATTCHSQNGISVSWRLMSNQEALWAN
jgi:hypothetical protein